MDTSFFEKENERLKAEIKKFEDEKMQKWGKRIKWAKRFSGWFLGKKLKSAINEFFTELQEKRSVTKDTLSELMAAIFMRITRIGAFLFITSLLPALLLILQVYYLRNQNKLISGQNNRLEQQTYLQEADRRSYMTGVLDDMIKEVTTEGYRNGGKISKVSSTRLVALSKILKPYKYLENDKLIEKPLSPERGYLLLSLLESNLDLGVILDNNTRESLLSELNFDYAELNNAVMTGLDLNRIHLDQSNLDGSNFTKSTFIYGYFNNASLKNVNFYRSDILNCEFKGANLEFTSFKDSALTNVDFTNANLNNADFSNCDLSKINLKNASIINTNFENATVTSNWIDKQKEILDSDSFDYLEENFKIKTQDKRSIIMRK